MRNDYVKFILNLGQWFRRICRLRDFLSGALVALLFFGAKPLCNFKKGHHKNIHVKLYGT